MRQQFTIPTVQMPVPPANLPADVRAYLDQVAKYLNQFLTHVAEPAVVRGYGYEFLSAPRSGSRLRTGELYVDQDSYVRVVASDEAWAPKTVLKLRVGSVT